MRLLGLSQLHSRTLFWLARASGLLLFLSDYPVHCWGLQLVALIPFFLALNLASSTGTKGWQLGLTFALYYIAPLFVVAGFAAPIVVVALLALVQWPLMATLCLRLRICGPMWFGLGSAAIFAGTELVLWHGVPLFGTAPCFARVMSAAPWAVQFASLTGMSGVVFVLALSQAWLAAMILSPQDRRRLAWAWSCLMLSLCVLNQWLWTRPLGPNLSTAVAGWGDVGPPNIEKIFTQANQATPSAKLLVTPEGGYSINADSTDRRARMSALCHQYKMAAAIGAFLIDQNENHILFFDEMGQLSPVDYAKTHLIPMMESYEPGDGVPPVQTLAGVTCSGMICQDDNFTDLSRASGRLGTQLMLVPTNDWKGVHGIHFDNSVFRAIEQHYAIARATSGGISALISPRGEVLTSMDHIRTPEPAVITAEVPVGLGQPTVYARCGDWPMAAIAIFLLVIACRRQQAISRATT